MEYSLYFLDLESTGLLDKHDVIELSIIRSVDNVQKTWFIKPLTPETADADALRINHHKIEDLRGETKYGRDTYLDPNKVLVEVENFVMEDNLPTSNRVMVGQNITFDKRMLENLWRKCNSSSSFPFGRRFLDTMVIQFFLDYCKGEMMEGYSLANLIKKYGVTNSKAHSAAADIKATTEVFEKQVDIFKKLLKNG